MNTMGYDNILATEYGDGALRASVITLNRPKQHAGTQTGLADTPAC